LINSRHGKFPEIKTNRWIARRSITTGRVSEWVHVLKEILLDQVFLVEPWRKYCTRDGQPGKRDGVQSPLIVVPVAHRMSSALQRAPPSSSSRRSPSISSPRSTTITKGATARSAINPRVSASLNSPRRSSLKSTTPPPVSADAQDALADSLKRETEEKERVCGRVHSLPPARCSRIPSSSSNCRTRNRPSEP
jgi:hypothetical protein